MPETMQYCPFRLAGAEAGQKTESSRKCVGGECALYMLEGLGGKCALRVIAEALHSVALKSG
jgi:hypothetical protein